LGFCATQLNLEGGVNQMLEEDDVEVERETVISIDYKKLYPSNSLMVMKKTKNNKFQGMLVDSYFSFKMNLLSITYQ
jgi:hypothetical protein